LEAGLIATLRQMDYEYVQIVEEDNLYANFKRQLEIHNRKRLEEHGRCEFTTEEFEKILIYLEGGTRFEKAKKLRDLYPHFANNPNSGYKFTFNWTDAANHPFNELDKFAEFFLEKCNLGKIIGKYIVLHEGDKSLMVLRPYQFYAVEKILDRVQNSNDNGYIWHTTGAGKTLTSFKAAQLVSELEDVVVSYKSV